MPENSLHFSIFEMFFKNPYDWSNFPTYNGLFTKTLKFLHYDSPIYPFFYLYLKWLIQKNEEVTHTAKTCVFYPKNDQPGMRA